MSLIYLRQHILPQLEGVGLIIQERSTGDSREMVVIPVETEVNSEEMYSVQEGRVNSQVVETTHSVTKEPLTSENLF